MLDKDEKKTLLSLARKTICKKEKKIWLSNLEIDLLSDNLKEKRGGFVTLYINNNLRGCIGYILPIFPLYETVIENAYNAAYSDPRFPPISENEIEKIHIEISILSIPEKLNYNNASELLNKLNPLNDGVIIKRGYHSATFLPQVWEQIPDKKEFLQHLCMKAGLSLNEWENGTLEVEIYHAEVFEEE
jgi:AmmeMemoRadiSam system protein A